MFVRSVIVFVRFVMASSLSQFGTQTAASLKNGSCRSVKLTNSTPRVMQRPSSFVVRAAAAGKADKTDSAPWTPPSLDPSTPSPIFGGSTGGLLRKAQVGKTRTRVLIDHLFKVEEFYVITWDGKKEQIFEMPTGGAAIMRKGTCFDVGSIGEYVVAS